MDLFKRWLGRATVKPSEPETGSADTGKGRSRVTPWQLALREAQAPVTDALKPLGFRKVGNYYNREVDDGLIQVVGFQSGQYVSILHGNFTINLGVHVPAVAVLEQNEKSGRAVSDAQCEVRRRLLRPGWFGHKWWPLDKTAGKSGQQIAGMLLNDGIPFLDGYASHARLIERFERDGVLPSHNRWRSALAVGIVCHRMGDRAKAEQLFAKACDGARASFKEYVASIRLRLAQPQQPGGKS